MELRALKEDKCLYATYYNLPNGRIVVSIDENAVTIHYFDKEGFAINEKEREQDALKDL